MHCFKPDKEWHGAASVQIRSKGVQTFDGKINKNFASAHSKAREFYGMQAGISIQKIADNGAGMKAADHLLLPL
ncbi:MAG: hypothetical protein AAGB22_15495, partial [Bacteroidota bacterium]